MPSIVNLICTNCKSQYSISLKNHNQNLRRKYKNNFCCIQCKAQFYSTCSQVSCKNCGISFTKKRKEIERTKNNFCSKSCAATYNNLHKKTGTRRSKFEKYIEEQLIQHYPNLIFHFNQKHIINSELDVYIPELNIAFEMNGIYHYKPIHGNDKFKKIKKNDKLKSIACKKNNIDLYTINISKLVYFSKKHSQKYLELIFSIINSNYMN